MTKSTPNADLIAYAAELGLSLTDRGARKLRERIGNQRAARARLESVAALVVLASALEWNLTQLGAARRLDAVGGDYDVARGRLIGEIEARRSGVFAREWSRLEIRYYSRDAHVRYAAFFADLDEEARLGYRTSMLLVAAADAELRKPDAEKYRIDVTRAVGMELQRRYPSRRQEEWEVLADEDVNSRHREIQAKAIADERHAREMVLKKLPELQQRIELLADSLTMRTSIEQILREIRRRLEEKAADPRGGIEHGWSPNPARYRREVADAARETAARSAA